MKESRLSSRIRPFVRMIILASCVPGVTGSFEHYVYGQNERSIWPTHLESTSRRDLSRNMLVEQHEQFEQFLLDRIAATASQIV